jgi:osmoprotectant transport system permease protein
VSRRLGLAALVLASLALATPPAAAEAPTVRVGSKKFTESVVLGELAAALARSTGAAAEHRRDLGGTRILFEALRADELDVYAEYTGTLEQELLAGRGLEGWEDLHAALAERGLVLGRPLGFNNTYAIGMREERAAELGIERVSQLREHPELLLGFTAEFLDRGDGWPALQAAYALPHERVRGLDHDVAYRGLVAGSIDVMDLYSTDAEIEAFGLRVLEDDLGHFPRYEACLLWRVEMEEAAPEAVAAWRSLEGELPAPVMIALNARVRLDGVPEAEVAAQFLTAELGLGVQAEAESVAGRLLRHGREHLVLTGVSLSGALLVAIPLGIAAARRRRLGQVVLAVVGVVQTVPSFALLVIFVPLLGIGGPPAIAALFLYSLLPIVRNTHSGLLGLAPELRESAVALGLPEGARLRLVELPLALPSILAGVKTAAVLNVGTATLGALVGAGGYGEPILTGIRLADTARILEGAVPAALLALLVQGLFDGLERLLVSPGLRG